MSEYENTKDEKIINKTFLLMFFTSISSAIVLYILISPITDLCYSLTNDLSLSGLASGIYVIGGTFSLIFSGQFFRKWGLKKSGIVFLTIHFFTCFLYFLPLNITNLLLIRFIHGFGIGIGFTAITSITAHVIPKNRHGEGLGVFYLAEPLAIGLCSLINIIFNGNLSFSGYLIIAVIFSGIVLFNMIIVPFDDSKLSFEPQKDKSRNKIIDNFIEISTLPVAIGTMLACFGYTALLTFSEIYSAEVNLVNAFSYFFLIYMVAVIFLRPLFGRLLDKTRNSKITIIPIILQTISLFLIVLYPCEAVVYLTAIFTALGYGTLYPIGLSMAIYHVSDERKPLAISTYILFNDLVLGFGASILGLYTFMGVGTIFITAAILTLLGLPPWIYFLKVRKKKISLSKGTL